MTGLEVLAVAKTIIEERGWAQDGAASFHGGPVCANIAIFLASPGSAGWDARHEARQILGRIIPLLKDDDLVKWNDEPERTKEEVLDTFAKAIALAVVA